MVEVKGYKAFNKDETNRYGMPFTVGKTYYTKGELKFGNNGNGWHMCTALSDVFRYVNAMEEDVVVAEVTGRGAFIRRDDDYNGYYDMYCFEEMTIDRFLTRDEIIDKMLVSPPHDVLKFLSTCRLSEEEKILFLKNFRNDFGVIRSLLYYHFDYLDIYNSYSSAEKQIRKVLMYGQDNNKGCKRK
ncbi:MAG: hypothetical protein ACI4XM_06475 [Candidatus Coprovivens sp.]